ncbi:MAG: alpha/beta hydrolase [Rhodoplanes sp.]|uniref:alpha/beta fold hydrolase n=1 Tax=Rhodoplanes sp. TaxID=1968906 RepID=UPI0017C91EB8|nr:alpha/beta hydrolase [Rhodoplanes sp.]NVO12820.1 alpha/beta hydrolase [Rhodoplanes sp.]
MGYVTASDGVKLYYEEAGTGTPIVFVHEFGGDHRGWEPQMRFFARRYRCITFAARGYPPSDVPTDLDGYSQARATSDIADVVTGLGLDKAHIVGLSMGGFATVHFGLDHADKALSLVVAGAGYGAEKQHEAYFKGVSENVAKNFLEQGSKKFAETYALGASRVQFQNKDPRGWREFADQLGQHSATGAANTMRGVQVRRPSLYDLEDRLRKMPVPTLVVSGDEDDHCLQPALYMKRVIPACGLLILPKTGHTINLEEPAVFNAALAEFLAMVEAGKWLPRDPRADPGQVMRTD